MFHRMGCRILSILAILVCLVVLSGSVALAGDGGHPRLGLSVSAMQTSEVLRQHLRLADGEGVLVSNVVVGGELEAAGISQGDIVLAVDGNPVGKPSDLTQYISDLPKGTRVKLDVIHSGEHEQVFVTLDNLPDDVVWKYMDSVAAPGRSQLGRGRMQMPQGSQPLARSMNQVSTYSSVVATNQGIQMSTVTISGDKSDPSSTVEVVIGDNRWKTTVDEVDSLPDEAREVARNALKRQDAFSFGMDSSDMFEDMMRRHYEQMRRMDEMFRQFSQPGVPGQVPNQPLNPGNSGGFGANQIRS